MELRAQAPKPPLTRLGEQDAERRREAALGSDFSEALARGLRVLVAFNAGHRSRSLSELAAAVGLPRATARRALLTLQALGYVEAEGRQFRLTTRVLRLASAYLTSNVVSTLLQPVCDRIAREVGQSCTAAVLEGGEAVMVARALPAELVPAGMGIGYRLPAYCSALGRVLLSGLPEQELATYLATAELAPITARTRTAPGEIRAAVAQARRDGFCYSDGEAEQGFRSVAIPLRRFDGMVVAALNIGSRAETTDRALMTGRYLDVLREAASGLTGLLA